MEVVRLFKVKKALAVGRKTICTQSAQVFGLSAPYVFDPHPVHDALSYVFDSVFLRPKFGRP